MIPVGSSRKAARVVVGWQLRASFSQWSESLITCLRKLHRTIFRRATLLRQRLKPMLLYNREKFEGHATRLFGASFPLLNRRFTGIEITGENRLAHTKALAELLDLLRLERRRSGETGCVETPHRCLVDSAHFVHR